MTGPQTRKLVFSNRKADCATHASFPIGNDSLQPHGICAAVRAFGSGDGLDGPVHVVAAGIIEAGRARPDQLDATSHAGQVDLLLGQGVLPGEKPVVYPGRQKYAVGQAPGGCHRRRSGGE